MPHDAMSRDRWSGARYDEVASPQTRWGTEVVDRLRLGPAPSNGFRIADLGCGSGRVTEVLLRRHPDARVVAVDVSASMVGQAKARLASFAGRVEVVHADLEGDIAADLGAGTFDAIFSTGTLHWIRDHRAMYRAFFSLLAPGGVLVAQCGGRGGLVNVLESLDRLGVEWRSRNCYADPEESARWLSEAGFDDVWTWSSSEHVAFEKAGAFIDYLADGVLAPYCTDVTPGERRALAERVAKKSDAMSLDFVRLNLLARAPALIA
jgi:trans-aconitate 2-methyltransferase